MSKSEEAKFKFKFKHEQLKFAGAIYLFIMSIYLSTLVQWIIKTLKLLYKKRMRIGKKRSIELRNTFEFKFSGFD